MSLSVEDAGMPCCGQLPHLRVDCWNKDNGKIFLMQLQKIVNLHVLA
jgi:hypothetical protein